MRRLCSLAGRVKAGADGQSLQLEYAGLARGEDPAIALAVADLERAHRAAMDAAGLGTATPTPATGPDVE